MTTTKQKSTKRAVSLLLLCGICGLSFALPPMSSSSFRVNYSLVPNGVGHLTSASYQARASVVGQASPRLATSIVPVTVSAFNVE